MSIVLLMMGAGLIALTVTAWVNRNALRLRLIEAPNQRSSHARPTPSGGGLGVALAGSIAGIWVAWNQNVALWLTVGLAILLAGVGLWDDIRQLPAKMRFGVQILVCALLLWALGDLSPQALILSSYGIVVDGWLLFGLLLLTGVWWINLFNFMDGIDGIAGSQAVFMLASAAGLGAWLYPETVNSATWLWMLAIMSATAGFLMLNWPPARIFMGDVGSTYLGFMIFALALLAVREGWLAYSSWLILGALFIADATVTLLRRMLARERWFEAHRSHAYQRLSQRWDSHLAVTLLAITINLLWLLPLTWISLVQPQWAWHCVVLAYAPLLAGVVMLGAGKKSSEQLAKGS